MSTTRYDPVAPPGGSDVGGPEVPIAQAPEHASAEPQVRATQAWSLSKRIAFRFAFAYFTLTIFPSPLGIIPGLSKPVDAYPNVQQPVIRWVARHVFHLSQTVSRTSQWSGDKTYDYVQLFCVVVLAAIAALVWSILDRRRNHYEGLFGFLRIYVRYYLACTMINYGLAKVFQLQFGPPGMWRLVQPYGESSPMGLLWTFMGASGPYSVFGGLAEFIPGLLLFFRRTTTLGALMLTVVLINIVMINFCYDVPVKIYSCNLLLMTLFLLLPERRRLANVLIWDRQTEPVNIAWAPADRRIRVAGVMVQVAFIGLALFHYTNSWITRAKAVKLAMAPTPPYGTYDVEEFIKNGEAALTASAVPKYWRRVALSTGGLAVRTVDDSVQNLKMQHDAPTKKFTSPENPKSVLTYVQPDEGHLVLEGTVLQDSVKVRLRKIERSNFLLVNRGFHWINEVPYNR